MLYVRCYMLLCIDDDDCSHDSCTLFRLPGLHQYTEQTESNTIQQSPSQSKMFSSHRSYVYQHSYVYEHELEQQAKRFEQLQQDLRPIDMKPGIHLEQHLQVIHINVSSVCFVIPILISYWLIHIGFFFAP